MTARAAGEFRRTPIERSDQRVAWERADQAFFAAGACHILAWACRETYPEEPVQLAGVRFPGEHRVFHTYAVWEGWAFDHSGWNAEEELLLVNEQFEDQPLERIAIDVGLDAFCRLHHHRMPDQYWLDPRRRAHEYAVRYTPPWRQNETTSP